MWDSWGGYRWKKRTKAGKALDKAYANHKIGWTYYNKVRDKKIYWEYKK